MTTCPACGAQSPCWEYEPTVAAAESAHWEQACRTLHECISSLLAAFPALRTSHATQAQQDALRAAYEAVGHKP